MNLLDPVAPSPLATGGFVALVAVVGIAVTGMTKIASVRAGEDAATARRRATRTGVAIAGWLALSAAIATTGILARFDTLPPPFLLIVGSSAILSAVLAFSRFGTLLAGSLPISMLVGLHVFRLPLELVLYQLSLDGVLPVQMTFDGMNYDILTGIFAGAIGLWASVSDPPRIFVRAWNLMGLALLLTIVTIAILSAPVPFRVFMNEPANTIVATVPYVWLPMFLVQLAWLGHLLVFRRLSMERKRL